MQAIITCAPDSGVDREHIENSRLFQDYYNGLATGWKLISFEVKWAIVRPSGDIIMMFAVIECTDEEDRRIICGSLLRGTTVEILPVISTPAGMRDSKTIAETIDTELREEIGIDEITWDKPELLDGPMFVSPGGSNEEVVYYFRMGEVDAQNFAKLRGNVAGNAEESERTKTLVLPLNASIFTRLEQLEAAHQSKPCGKTRHLLLMFLCGRHATHRL